MGWTMQNPDADPLLPRTDFIASGIIAYIT